MCEWWAASHHSASKSSLRSHWRASWWSRPSSCWPPTFLQFQLSAHLHPQPGQFSFWSLPWQWWDSSFSTNKHSQYTETMNTTFHGKIGLILLQKIFFYSVTTIHTHPVFGKARLIKGSWRQGGSSFVYQGLDQAKSTAQGSVKVKAWHEAPALQANYSKVLADHWGTKSLMRGWSCGSINRERRSSNSLTDTEAGSGFFNRQGFQNKSWITGQILGSLQLGLSLPNANLHKEKQQKEPEKFMETIVKYCIFVEQQCCEINYQVDQLTFMLLMRQDDERSLYFFLTNSLYSMCAAPTVSWFGCQQVLNTPKKSPL